MEKYLIKGMTCAACQARIERAVAGVPGVDEYAVSLLTNTLSVSGKHSCDDIINAVREAGYGISPSGKCSKTGKAVVSNADTLEDVETPLLKKRLLSSLVFLLPLMYLSMGHAMWGLPLPDFFNANPVRLGIMQLLLAAVVMIINQRFFINGFKSLLKCSPNMDTLVSLGSAASFIYSTAALLLMANIETVMVQEQAAVLLHDFHFESAAMILTLITVGKMLEARTKGRTTDALKGLMKLVPVTATVIRNGEELTIPAEQIVTGETFIVRPGESIPVDGTVLEGSSAVDEAALTGESVPVDKIPGSTVNAATINKSGFLRCSATRIGENTAFAQIIRMVEDAAATKAPIAKIADRVSGFFVPAVIAIAIVTILCWLFAGEDFGFALSRGVAVLVISCPCALGLATPVAIMVANGVAARHGIMFKTARSLEETGRTKIVALDKTGTITTGKPAVTDVLPAGTADKNKLIDLALSIECKSDHPLAAAIVGYAEENHGRKLDSESFTEHPGCGLEAVIAGERAWAGSLKYIRGKINLEDNLVNAAEQAAEEGKTPILFASGNSALGMIAVADTVKNDSSEAVKQLKEMGIRVVMLTGDSRKTAEAIGKQAGIDEIIAEIMPDEKEAAIRRLQKEGKVAMAGDGINDAPALTAADTGIAIGAGTDIALDAADVILVKSRLSDIPAAIGLSRATLVNIQQNLFWAFFYNVIGIPLAAGCFTKLLGWSLNPMFGAAAMSLSSFFVVSNALRLNLFKMPALSDDIINNAKRENSKKMKTKTLTIEGMMCHHCEKAVKKALEALENVSSADVSHEKGTAVVQLKGEVADDVLKTAVEAEEFKVTAIS